MSRKKLIKMCFDRILEGNDVAKAEAASVKENVANAGPQATPAPFMPLEAVLLTSALWKPGRVLRARFLDGDPRVQTKVIAVAKEWEKYANIKFEFGNDPEAEIRISFMADRGSWSFVGTQALTIAKDKPTMNLGWLSLNTANEEYNRVVLHEFGHALGLLHEHQNPTVNIPWNRPAVYRAYAAAPNFWTPDKVDINIFNTYDKTQTQYSQFDSTSIMLYPVPKELTLGGFEVGWNSALSAIDKEYIAKVYPFDLTPIVDLTVGAAPLEAGLETVGEVDTYRFVVTEAGNYVIETGGRTDVRLLLFGPNDRSKQIGMDDDSGPGLNARLSMALEPGVYYAQVKHYRQKGQGKYRIYVKKA